VIERDGKLVAALLAVRRARWDDTSDCPFITDLFTDQRFRRQGLARTLLIRMPDSGKQHRTATSGASRPQRQHTGNAPLPEDGLRIVQPGANSQPRRNMASAEERRNGLATGQRLFWERLPTLNEVPWATAC
jgi:hypothetical protein